MSGFENLISECDKNFDFYTKHLEELRENISSLDDIKEKLQNINPDVDLTDFIEAEHLNNYSGYITIAILELSVNLKNLVLAKADWEKVFFIKNSYLVIHETINKLYTSNKKSFIQLTVENKYPTLKSQFNEIVFDIENFKANSDYKKIEDVRHYTAGHIEKSLKKYYSTILKLNGEEAGQYISDFLKILHKAYIFSRDCAIQATIYQNKKEKTLEIQLDTLIQNFVNSLNK